MTSVISRIKGFFAFWYDFVVGDDWRVAVGVALTLGLIYGASRATATVWWIAPVAVVCLLSWSLVRVARRS